MIERHAVGGNRACDRISPRTLASHTAATKPSREVRVCSHAPARLTDISIPFPIGRCAL
jgi:hypothetical protein